MINNKRNNINQIIETFLNIFKTFLPFNACTVQTSYLFVVVKTLKST